MDPISMTASIIAVLQLTTTVMVYLNDVKNATSDQKKVAIEASNLYSLLMSLRSRVEEAHGEEDWFMQARLLNAENGPIQQFKTLLEKIVQQTAPLSSRQKIKAALVWGWTKNDVDAALTQMERLKSLINLALSHDSFKLSLAMHREIQDVNLATRHIRSNVEQLQEGAAKEFQDRIFRWLRIPDPSTNFNRASKSRHPGTGEWLLQNDIFQNWKASNSSLIWLHAGCGKTVLSATVLQDIITETSSDPSKAVAYFYFDFNDKDKQQSQNAARSLLFQFATQIPDGLNVLAQLNKSCSDGHIQPTDEQIQTTMETLLALTDQNFIVLDALDECQEREDLLEFITTLTSSKDSKASVLATSRLERDIDVTLRPIADWTLNIQNNVVDADIGAYIRGRLNTDVKLRKWPEEVKDHILQTLMHKANGMFRWVYCQIESLRNCIKRSKLELALASLPQDLDDTYARILQSIESRGHLTDAVRVLQWLCYSLQPLSLAQLVDVVAIEPGRNPGVFFDPMERLPDPYDILEICSNLISYDENARPDEYEEEEEDYDNPFFPSTELNDDDNRWINCGEDDTDGTTSRFDLDTPIRLAHFSVKEYLLSDRCSFRSDFEPVSCNSVLGTDCLQYVRYLGHNFDTIHRALAENPLASYAARYLAEHMRESRQADDGGVAERTYEFLSDQHSLKIWRELCAKFTFTDLRPRGDLNLTDSVYYAVCFGHAKVVDMLLRQELATSPHKTDHVNSLCIASSLGFEDIVKLLIEVGTDVGACSYYGVTPLEISAREGHDEVLRLLIEAGASSEVRGEGYRGGALFLASRRGYGKVIQHLIDADGKLDTNLKEGFHESALQIAAWNGHEDVVRVLVDAGVNVNRRIPGTVESPTAGSPLREGHEKVVRFHIDADADVNDIRGKGSRKNALYTASSHGHEKVVRLLIDAGADVNEETSGNDHASALQAASGEEHEKVIRFPIDAGAYIGFRGSGFRTSALQAASIRGYNSIVQMLLKAGAERDDVAPKMEPTKRHTADEASEEEDD